MPMPMKVLVKNLAGILIESGPPGHTGNTCLHIVGIVAAHEDHHKSHNAAATDDGRMLLGSKMSHVLQTNSGASAASSNGTCYLCPQLSISCLAPYPGPLSSP